MTKQVWHVDFTGLDKEPIEEEDKPPDSIAPGKYIVEIMRYTHRVRPGVEYLSWELRVVPGPAIHPEFRLYHVTSFAPQTLWALREFIEAATGVRPEGVVEFEPAKLVGQHMVATVGVHQWQEKVRNQIKRLQAIT